MALPDLKPNPVVVFWTWVRRIFVCLVLVLLEFVVFARWLSQPPYWVGFALAPLMAFAVWQTGSRLTTGEYFSFALDPMVRTPRQLADLLCTIGCSGNVLFFVYHLYLWLPPEHR